MTVLDRLTGGKYLLVTTFRKDGTPVPTPVWVVRDGDAPAVWTPAVSGKVKRIRRDPQVEVAPCDFKGKPDGPPVTGRAEILDAAGSARVRALVRRRFGVTGWLVVTGSLLRRGRHGTVGIRITVD